MHEMPYKLDRRKYFLLYMNLTVWAKISLKEKIVVFAKTLVLNLIAANSNFTCSSTSVA
jgi:hypothetical protein